MMTDEVRLATLRASKLAADLSEDEHKVLAGVVVVRELADGEVLVREGTLTSTCMSWPPGTSGSSSTRNRIRS